MKAPNGFIMKDEAASILGCKRRTVDNLMSRRVIPFYKFGRRVMFKSQELLRAVEDSRVASRNSMTEQTLYNRRVSGLIPDVTNNESECNTAWDEVCRWLRIASQSSDQKKKNLAESTLKFIMKFEL